MKLYKNILITGGCGFIGSNFINYIFNKTTANIINIDKISYCSNENNIQKHILKSSRYNLYKINNTIILEIKFINMFYVTHYYTSL